MSFGNDSRLLLNWSNSSQALTLAFSTSSLDNSSLTSGVIELAAWRGLSPLFQSDPPGVSPVALSLFNAAISNASANSSAPQTLGRGEHFIWIGYRILKCNSILEPVM